MPAKKSEKKQVVVFARAPNSNWARILYGTLVSSDVAKGTATLSDVRQCLYYSKETGGEAGLSAIGPQPGSRVSPKTTGKMDVAGVGLVAECSAAAVSAWENFK
jgi:hypothetical protein